LLTALECTKFVFGQDSDPDPTWWGLTALPSSPGWFEGPYFVRGGEDGRKEGKGHATGRKKGGKQGEGRRKGKRTHPIRQFLSLPMKRGR